VINSYATDQQAMYLVDQLALVSPNEHGYSLHQGVVRKGSLIWIGNNSTLKTKLIAEFHSSAMGGHSVLQATYQRIKKYFVWKGLKSDADSFVKQCTICQHAKSERVHPTGLLQPLPVPQGIWQDISMDFIEGLPKSEGFNTILVVVDRLSKYAHFLPLKHSLTTQHIAKVIMEGAVKHHGMPRSIISDRDKIFTSNFWKELFRLSNTTLLTSTTYHPQTDGQIERVDQCLEMFLW
jgi:hypothetical protein